MLPASSLEIAGEACFNRHVCPLLTEHCLACHGPDSASRKADLRVDRRDSALGKGVILPGDADASGCDDLDVVMPAGGRLGRQGGGGPAATELVPRWRWESAEGPEKAPSKALFGGGS